MSNLNVEHKIKRHILNELLEGKKCPPTMDTPEQVDAAWDLAHKYVGVFKWLEIIDAIDHFRYSGEKTDLPAESSRCYKCVRVARVLSCGTAVSWLYWSGGGKHGEPDAIEFMTEESGAYEVDFTDKEKVITISFRTYTKKKS